MESLLLQQTRQSLEARVRQALHCPMGLFAGSCGQLLAWIDEHPIVSPIAADLRREPWEFLEPLHQIVEQVRADRIGVEVPHWVAADGREHAALCLGVVTALAGARLPSPSRMRLLLRRLHQFLTGDDTYDDRNRALPVVREVAVQGLHDYLFEQLDGRGALLGVLIKYKRRSEWFRRHRLRMIANAGFEGRPVGEGALALDLCEYLYDQGVNYTPEPPGPSLERDTGGVRPPVENGSKHDSGGDVRLRVDGRRIVIDARYIAPEDTPQRIKELLARGFRTVARACDDVHEPGGYLVVFHNHERRLRLPLEETDGLRYLRVGGKMVDYLSVRIGKETSSWRPGQHDQTDQTDQTEMFGEPYQPPEISISEEELRGSAAATEQRLSI